MLCKVIAIQHEKNTLEFLKVRIANTDHKDLVFSDFTRYKRIQ